MRTNVSKLFTKNAYKMPASTTIRALFHPLENEAKETEKEKKEHQSHQQRFVESKSTFFSSKFILFFFDSGRKTKEISIPVAFDKQKSNFLIGPSALWWREAFAISSSLLREEESINGVTVNGGYKTNDEAAMADLGHAAEATLEIARVVSGTMLEDLRRTTRSLEFWEEKRDEYSRGGDVSHRMFLTLRCGPRAFIEETKGFVKRKAVAARRRAMYVSTGNARRKNGESARSNISGEEKEREEEHLLETLLTVPPARAVIDGKVAALGKMQRSLASAVARVHARADDLVNGDYNRRKRGKGEDDDEDEDEDEEVSEEELRKREVEKTRDAVERCVNGINEAIELVKSTASSLNAEHEDEDDEDNNNNESKKRNAEEAAEAERNDDDDHDNDDHDDAISPRRPSSSLERTISNSPLFAGMMHNRTNSLVSSISRSGTPKIPDSPKSAATQVHASSRLSSSPQNNNSPTLRRQNASLQRSNSYFQNLIKNTFLGDIFLSDGGTGARVGFVSHKLRTRLMAKSGEPIPFPLENDVMWEAIVRTESRFEKARKAVGRTVERHRKPTKYERRWIPISVLMLIGVSSAIVLVRKSSLCGSTELDETLKAAYETTRTFFNSYMKTPSKELKQELTKAFDTGDREDAAARLDESQESLDRMLKEYVKNATKPGFSESLTRAYQSVGAMTGGGGDEHAEGSRAGVGPGEETTTANKIDPMSLVTARVEEELKAPLQNMLGGDLMQLLLIQTQVMKVEMEDALLQMDAVMRANRLNFALMACFPATLFVYGSVSFSKTVGAARAFQKRRKAREEMRLLVADAERSLMRLKMTRDEFTKRRRALEDNNEDNSDSDDASDSNLIHRLEIAEEHRRRRLELDASFDATAAPSSPAARLHATKNKFDDENLENETFHQGMLLYAVNALYASVQKHKRMFTPKEFRGVKLDAMALADVGVSIEGKLLTTQRLARIYKGFQSEPHRVPSIVTGRYPI